MKKKSVLLCFLIAAVLLVSAGCSQEQTPYQINDADNYSVSVRYDANGGTFTTNTSVIVDSYNITELKTNSEGKAELALIAPDNEARGNDAFTAVNNGYFLAGWYTERVQSGSEVTGYTYSGKWDFENDRLEVDPTGTYTSAEPVLTLYAAWVPLFSVEFYDLSTGEQLSSLTFNPTADGPVKVPAWDTETGTVQMYNFPERTGYTFNGAYYDAEGKQPVTTAELDHPGTVDLENGTAQNASMKLYVDWMEGEWYHIYNVDQFVDNASVTGNYVIHADLDFTDAIWPSVLMHGNFAGTIQGNGHSFSNITLEQTNNSKVNTGLFGQLTETAGLQELTFENVSLTIKSGTRVAGAAFGLLAGTVSADATFTNVAVLDSRLQIDSNCYFGTEDYVIGLVCGMGQTPVDPAGITCTAVGDAPESVVTSVEGGAVSVIFS